MTADGADQRIILSRRTLARFVAMSNAGEGPSPENLPRITDEIALLEAIAEDHPIKAHKLAALVMDWVKLREGMMARLN